MLDLLLPVQLGAAAALLLAALSARRPQDLTALPSLILLATLLRLALNVSTTRAILARGDAGAVVAAFGDAVVAGNPLVGAVVFTVVTLAQYLVVARGAERVAQVGARFALDGLPGRQLAIDADVRSGVLDPESARARRAALVAESNYFGAMDGAMKFVRGDAIAGLCIVAVNVVGGLAIGVLQRGLPLDRALHVYTTLTVGDGLLAQIPSLLNATAAGLVVTRIAEPEGLGAAVARQLGGRPVLVAAGGLLAGLGLLPGLPALAFVPVGGALAAGGLWRRRAEALREPARLGVCVQSAGMGTEAAEAADRLRREYGLDVPEPEVRVSAELPPGGWRVEVGGAAVARGVGAAELAATCAAAWRRHAGAWWGVQAVSDRLARLEETQPALVRAVVPRRFDVPRLARLLQRLVAEDVPVRDLAAILEALADAPADAPLRAARRGLAPLITDRFAPAGRVDALLPSAALEAALRTATGPAPDLLDDVVDAVRSALARRPRAVLLVAPDVREAACASLHPALPDLPIVSAEELLPGTRAEPVAVIG